MRCLLPFEEKQVDSMERMSRQSTNSWWPPLRHERDERRGGGSSDVCWSRGLYFISFSYFILFFFWFKLVRHRRWFQRTLQSPTFAKALSVVSLFAEWAAAPSMTAHLPFCTPNWSAVKPLIYADQSASYRPSKKAKKNVTTHANELAVTVGGVGPHVSCKPLSSTLTSCQFPFPVAICIRTHSVNIESK